MEALSGGNGEKLEVSAAINLGAEEHETIALQCTKEGHLSATLVDLKEKCMQVLGAHLQRHSVPLDEPDVDVLEETFDEDEDEDEELVTGMDASTEQFQCAKCGQRKTNYFQVQSKNAGDPMTLFVACLTCNARWKIC